MKKVAAEHTLHTNVKMEVDLVRTGYYGYNCLLLLILFSIRALWVERVMPSVFTPVEHRGASQYFVEIIN